MNEQIKEIAKVLCDDCAESGTPCREPMCDAVLQNAKALYDAGYRKQSEKYFIKENGDILPLTHHSEWISVEDRLPDREGIYLVCTYKKTIMFDYYGRFGVRDKPKFEFDVTHWMPLPEPPEMKGGK